MRRSTQFGETAILPLDLPLKICDARHSLRNLSGLAPPEDKMILLKDKFVLVHFLRLRLF